MRPSTVSRRRSSPVSDADIDLFREAIGEVRKIDAEAPAVTPEPPAPYPRMREADEAAVPRELLNLDFDPAILEIGEELSFLRNGYPTKILKQLKRGQFSVQADIDLHRMNAAAARDYILHFLHEARECGWRCVRIVHGKGLRSRPGGPVLKGLTDLILRRHGDVLAFASARPSQGGTGAVVVLLKHR